MCHPTFDVKLSRLASHSTVKNSCVEKENYAFAPKSRSNAMWWSPSCFGVLFRSLPAMCCSFKCQMKEMRQQSAINAAVCCVCHISCKGVHTNTCLSRLFVCAGDARLPGSLLGCCSPETGPAGGSRQLPLRQQLYFSVAAAVVLVERSVVSKSQSLLALHAKGCTGSRTLVKGFKKTSHQKVLWKTNGSLMIYQWSGEEFRAVELRMTSFIPCC